MRESIARVQHDGIWCSWMRYLFTQGVKNPDGSFTIPKDKVDRWTRQVNTSYDDLPDHERESDRDQADKVLDAVRTTFELSPWPVGKKEGGGR